MISNYGQLLGIDGIQFIFQLKLGIRQVFSIKPGLAGLVGLLSRSSSDVSDFLGFVSLGSVFDDKLCLSLDFYSVQKCIDVIETRP